MQCIENMSVLQQSGMESSSPPSLAPPAPPVSELMISKATSVTGELISSLDESVWLIYQLAWMFTSVWPWLARCWNVKHFYCI